MFVIHDFINLLIIIQLIDIIRVLYIFHRFVASFAHIIVVLETICIMTEIYSLDEQTFLNRRICAGCFNRIVETYLKSASILLHDAVSSKFFNSLSLGFKSQTHCLPVPAQTRSLKDTLQVDCIGVYFYSTEYKGACKTPDISH